MAPLTGDCIGSDVAVVGVGIDQQPAAQVRDNIMIDTTEIVVVAGAVALIALVLWYFFGGER